MKTYMKTYMNAQRKPLTKTLIGKYCPLGSGLSKAAARPAGRGRYLVVICLAATTLGSMITLGSTQPAVAQAAAPNPPVPAPPSVGLQIQEGVLLDFAKGARKTAEAQKIIYKGQMLTQSGSLGDKADTTSQFFLKNPQKSDTQNLLLDLTHGSGTVNQDIINALGLTKFSLPQVNLSPFSSNLGLDARLDGKQVRGTFGLESPSAHPIPGEANWVRLGGNVEQEWQDRSLGGNHTSGTGTYRAFLGKALWTRNSHVPLPFTLAELQNAAPTLDVLKAGHKATGNVELDQFVTGLTSLLTPTSPFPGNFPQPPDVTAATYPAFLQDRFTRYARAYQIEPGAAFWLESVGWYTFAGDPQGPRLQASGAAVATYYFDVNAQTGSLQLRYEDGYNRAAPGVRLNRLFISLGVTF